MTTEVVARAAGVLGELVLRRRTGDNGDPVVELIGDGVFLMDTEDASTERLLAERVLPLLDDEPLSVLVGGLGLGFTAAAVLRDHRVGEVVVVEIEPTLTSWLRAGLVPGGQDLTDDARLRVVHGDVREVLGRWPAGTLDAVLLDVDNGPGFLTHPSNATLYEPATLARVAATLRTGGVLAVWSAERSASLLADLTVVLGSCEEHPVVVCRHGRELEYVLYVAHRHRVSRLRPGAPSRAPAPR